VLWENGRALPSRIIAPLEEAIRSLDKQLFPLYAGLLFHDTIHIIAGTPFRDYAYIHYAAALGVSAFELISIVAIAAAGTRAWGLRLFTHIILIMMPLWAIRKLLLLSVPLGEVLCIGEFRCYLLLLARAAPVPNRVPGDPRSTTVDHC
jgi:hypothetical protein